MTRNTYRLAFGIRHSHGRLGTAASDESNAYGLVFVIRCGLQQLGTHSELHLSFGAASDAAWNESKCIRST